MKTKTEVAEAFIQGTRDNRGPVTVLRDDLALIVNDVEALNLDPDDTEGAMILVSGAELWNACGGTPAREVVDLAAQYDEPATDEPDDPATDDE